LNTTSSPRYLEARTENDSSNIVIPPASPRIEKRKLSVSSSLSRLKIKNPKRVKSEIVVKGSDLRSHKDDHSGIKYKGKNSSPLSTRKRRPHILVAEDNKINQKVIGKLLRKLNCEFDIVDDGVACIEALKGKNFDLILMDCMMPNMDGYRASSEIRQLETSEFNKRRVSKKIPIIAVTANSLAEEHAKCLKSGMDLVLTKPIQQVVLQKALYQYLTDDLSLEVKTLATGKKKIKNKNGIKEGTRGQRKKKREEKRGERAKEKERKKWKRG